jgi:hypothetical protein
MNAHAPIPGDPPAAPVEVLDRAQRRLERQLDVLEQLAEAGLEVALAIRDQAVGRLPEGAAPVVRGDIAMAYARAARAVRYSIVLQSKLTEELGAVETEAAAAREEAEELARLRSPLAVRRDAVEHIVESVVRAEYEAQEGAFDAEPREDVVDRLLIEADDRLEHEELYGDILARPISEVVAELCRDLGLHPDWPALAQSAWARREIDSGRAGAPLVHLPPRGGKAGMGVNAPPPPEQSLEAKPPPAPSPQPSEPPPPPQPLPPRWGGESIPTPGPVIPKPMAHPPPDEAAAPSGEPENLL